MLREARLVLLQRPEMPFAEDCRGVTGVARHLGQVISLAGSEIGMLGFCCCCADAGSTIAQASNTSRASHTFQPLFIVDLRLLIGVCRLRTPQRVGRPRGCIALASNRYSFG